MTALLAKLGLKLADGAGLGRLVVLLALLATVVVGGVVGVWYVADLGKRAAVAACDREKGAERDARRDAETRAREANREVIIRHTADAVRLDAGVEKERQEVQDDVAQNPQLVLCSLSDRGLRLWNADPLDAAVPDRPAAPGAEPAQPAPRPGRHAAAVDGQPHRVEARLQGALAQAP